MYRPSAAALAPPGRVFMLPGRPRAVHFEGARLRVWPPFVCGDRGDNRAAVLGALRGIADGLTARFGPGRGPGRVERVGLRTFAWVPAGADVPVIVVRGADR